MSDKVVPIVRQGGSNCPTKLILSDNLDQFSAKIQGGGFNSLNGTNLSGNVDHQIN